MSSPATPRPIDDIAALADPTRRALYDALVAAGKPLTRDQAAAEVGLTRSAAAYHLDRLATDGLLEVDFTRPTGRSGPGAGRPSKRYRRSDREVAVTLPPRSYGLAAEILLKAASSSAPFKELTQATAFETGRVAGERGFTEALAQIGFEPTRTDDETCFRNCPFSELKDVDLETICSLNLALVRGLIAGAGRPDLECELKPTAGMCCVRVRHTIP